MTSEIEEQNQRYYDAEARVYDQKRYGSIGGRRLEQFHQRILNRIIESKLTAGSSVLELGCGTGRLLEYLAQADYRLYGVDVSSGMLHEARQRLTGARRKVHLQEGDAHKLAFPDGTFQGVYSILVINLIPDYHNAFAEVARVLKPGGIFLFNVPNLASIYCFGGIYVNALGRTVTSNRAGYRYSHWFLPKEWRSALKRAGFEVEMVLGQPPHVRLIDAAAPLDASRIGLFLSKSVYVQARKKA